MTKREMAERATRHPEDGSFIVDPVVAFEFGFDAAIDLCHKVAWDFYKGDKIGGVEYNYTRLRDLADKINKLKEDE